MPVSESEFVSKNSYDSSSLINGKYNFTFLFSTMFCVRNKIGKKDKH